MNFKIFKENGAWDMIGTAGTMGLHRVSGTLVGLVAGYFLDRWLGTDPWFLIVFLLIGIAAGFKMIFEDTQRILRKQKEEDEHEGP